MRIHWVGEVAGLGSLDFLDVDSRLPVTTVGIAAKRRDLSAFTPPIGLPHVMVIGQTDSRAVFDNVTKVTSKLQPRRVVSIVVVNLVAGKEQHVGVDFFDIVDQVLAGDVATMRRLN